MAAADLSPIYAFISDAESVTPAIDLRGRMVAAIRVTSAAPLVNPIVFGMNSHSGSGSALVQYIDSAGAVTAFPLDTTAAADQLIELAGTVLPQGFGNGFLKIFLTGVEAQDINFILYTRPI